MAVKVEDNTQVVKDDINVAAALTIRLMLNDIHSLSTPVTPLRENALRTSVIEYMPSSTKGIITWEVPYAGVQEKGYRTNPSTGERIYFRNYTTPGTGPHYAEDSVKKVMANADKYMQQGGLI